jgi:N-acetylglucosamine-6-phosphate deacetylase
MILLSGAAIVLPDRILEEGTVAIDGDRIVEIVAGRRPGAARELAGHLIVPGFIDVHVHGVAGHDVMEGPAGLRAVARALPRFGVTAFAPTSIAAEPAALARALEAVREARERPEPGAARVLPAHLESNFVNPAWAGAQPVSCLRAPRAADDAGLAAGAFTAADILDVIDRAGPEVGTITLAPELEGALDLIRRFVARGHRVSLGHSGATYEQALAAVAAGASRATHLFNRMRPMTHRDPGLTGAALQRDELAAEIVCDGHHVHPAVVRVAIAAKSPSRAMAITDGTAGSGLPEGSRATLGGRPITVRDTARLDDGTMAGSVLTMDRAFAFLVGPVGLTPVEAAHLCATTPARELGLRGRGVLAPGAAADLTVLDPRLQVVGTYIGGRQVP